LKAIAAQTHTIRLDNPFSTTIVQFTEHIIIITL
jgi:hypothetical protein